MNREYNQQRHWGDGTADPGSFSHSDCLPRTPPARNGSRHEATFGQVYSEPGTYTAVLSFASENDCSGYDLYGSEGQDTVTVTALP